MAQQRTPIEISRTRAIYNSRSFQDKGKYFIWFWAEFSKAKTKRRKRNKQARKSRRINRLTQCKKY